MADYDVSEESVKDIIGFYPSPEQIDELAILFSRTEQGGAPDGYSLQQWLGSRLHTAKADIERLTGEVRHWRAVAEEQGGEANAIIPRERPPGPDAWVPRNVIEWDRDGVAIQRDMLREKLNRIRAAAESDPDLPTPLRDFLLHEAKPGWLNVSREMVERLRTTGSHRQGDTAGEERNG
jgi:hypothetical protein